VCGRLVEEISKLDLLQRDEAKKSYSGSVFAMNCPVLHTVLESRTRVTFPTHKITRPAATAAYRRLIRH